MKPHHHLDHSTVLAYAAGTLDEAFSIVVVSHLAWCDECRAAVLAAEQLGGELMAEISETAVSEACRTRTLALIDQATIHRFPAPKPSRSDLPAPLASVLKGASLDEIAWKKKAPGVAMHDIKLSPSAKGQLKLLRIGPGRAMPEHGHGGEEITLVLRGAYHDHLGQFARGDVADLDEDVEHQPVVDGDTDCICLVAIERPTRFKSLAARIMQPFVGI